MLNSYCTVLLTPTPLIEKQRKKKGEQNWPFPKSKTTIALHVLLVYKLVYSNDINLSKLDPKRP